MHKEAQPAQATHKKLPTQMQSAGGKHRAERLAY